MDANGGGQRDVALEGCMARLDDKSTLDYGRVRPRSLRMVRWAVLTCLAGGVVGYGYWRSIMPPPVPVVTSLAVSRTTTDVVEVPEDRVDAERIYREEVTPLLDQFDARNRAAVARAVANMHERLNGRRWGIKPFVKDVGSWKTRFGVIGRTTSDLWKKHIKKEPNAAAVRTYVNDKFRHHVLSEAALEHDMGEVLKQFREDLDASRNRLYVDVRLPLAKIKSPLAASDVTYAAFQADVGRRAREMGERWASDSVVSGLGGFVSGWVAMDVAQAVTSRVVVAILSRVGTQIAAETVAAGGATAAGAAAGGGGGSFAGPAGTVIGLGVGIAVGAVVDWWMSERFEAKMTAQLNGFFDSVDRQLVNGTDKAPGLERSLNDAVKLGGETQRSAMKKAFDEVTR
ncbi:MAG: hypothetical protein JWN40_2966 [Phycisphaerales bacterium]|nr:hypothetical protein [Phycisphaerales bacterium]